MRRLPWHVVLRVDRRGVLTSLGVALAVAFTFVSFAVPRGLEAQTVSGTGPLAAHDVLVAMPDLAPFDLSTLGNDDAMGFSLADVRIHDGREVTLAAIVGPLAPEVRRGDARPGTSLRFDDPWVEIVSPLRLFLNLSTPPHEGAWGRDWLLVSRDDFVTLAPEFSAGFVSYARISFPAAGETERLVEAGFELSRVPAVEPFFQASTAEVARALALVVAFSTMLVTLFTYEFLRSEVRERQREVGVWRALGVRANEVLVLLLGRALALCVAGLLVGGTLALVALQLASHTTGSAIFARGPSGPIVVLLVLAFLAASILGGFAPGWAVSRGIVSRQLEAAR